jgi:hypothetical protein
VRQRQGSVRRHMNLEALFLEPAHDREMEGLEMDIDRGD